MRPIEIKTDLEWKVASPRFTRNNLIGTDLVVSEVR